MSTKIAFLIAIVLGFIAAIAVKSYQHEEKQANLDKFAPRAIVIAKGRIKKGSLIRGNMFTIDYIPEPYIVQGMIPYEEKYHHIGKIARDDISDKAPIFMSQLENSAAADSPTEIVPVGKRTMTMRVDHVSGVAGLLRPGDYVDIVGTFSVPEPVKAGSSSSVRGSSRTKLIRTVFLQQAVKIIALDSNTLGDSLKGDRKRKSYRTVTFAVTPEEAMRLINAQQQAKIQLLLRYGGDVTPSAGINIKTGVPDIFWNIMKNIIDTKQFTGLAK